MLLSEALVQKEASDIVWLILFHDGISVILSEEVDIKDENPPVSTTTTVN